MTMPRGIRNNNPGNLRRSRDVWKGLSKEQADPEFCQFITAHDGLRALAIVLLNYQKRHKLGTVRKILTRFAPASENNLSAYIDSVCTRLGKWPDDQIDLMGNRQWLADLMSAIVRHENGIQPYSETEYYRAVDAAINRGE
ncbi:MAG TPA: structural protein [Rhodospirillaceae bacterium]|nr:MAG: hypothetical protein A2018_01295 [Alphaproteobacteria bacterium GWF2_58_20]HAU29793.1 structural protein [Rhodospirillaceae bacterium]